MWADRQHTLPGKSKRYSEGIDLEPIKTKQVNDIWPPPFFARWQNDVFQKKPAPVEISEPDASGLERAINLCRSVIQQGLEPAVALRMPRRDLAAEIRVLALGTIAKEGIELNRLEQRELVTTLINGIIKDDSASNPTGGAAEPVTDHSAPSAPGVTTSAATHPKSPDAPPEAG